MSEKGKKVNTTRIALVILVITSWSFLISIRLTQLQIFQHRMFVQLAAQKQQVTRSITPPRGIIYDCHMDELATSVTASTVIAEPRNIKDIPTTAKILADILRPNPSDQVDQVDQVDQARLLDRMTDPKHRNYLVVKRKIDPEAAKRIQSLKIDGVYLIDEGMRVYPDRELACQTLGFVNSEEEGISGIELHYEKDLQGKKGQYSYEIDARRKSFSVNVDTPPVQGHSLVLSIDKSIQYIADRELAAGVEKANASAGTAIVMESDTGRILAISNYPQFNCNHYNKYQPEHWRNRAVTDSFEPGSTFKVVVAASALEAGLTHPSEMIDCQMGTIKIGGHTFHDHKAYGLLSFSQILEFSSNVGASKLGLRLGEHRLYESIRTFGFGSKSKIDLPGEISGLVRDWHQWSGLSIGAISFGQEVGVTSIQILTAINSIANGGFRVRPLVVDRIIDEKGDLVSVHTPERVRIMSDKTAEAVASAFERVVIGGTGKKATLEGYRAAGKTGTAQKIDRATRAYSKSKYVSSFIGFAPLPKPKITVLVQLDEPKGSHYGGDVSAPIFQKITQNALLQLQVPPDKSVPLSEFKPLIASDSSRNNLPNPVQPPKAKDKPKENPNEIVTAPVGRKQVTVPDFKGMGKRTVLNRCIELGIRLQASGAGVAVVQSPIPGTKIYLGSSCAVGFTRTNVKGQIEAAETRYQSERLIAQKMAASRQ